MFQIRASGLQWQAHRSVPSDTAHPWGFHLGHKRSLVFMYMAFECLCIWSAMPLWHYCAAKPANRQSLEMFATHVRVGMAGAGLQRHGSHTFPEPEEPILCRYTIYCVRISRLAATMEHKCWLHTQTHKVVRLVRRNWAHTSSRSYT
jgi:hypothetical protein